MDEMKEQVMRLEIYIEVLEYLERRKESYIEETKWWTERMDERYEDGTYDKDMPKSEAGEYKEIVNNNEKATAYLRAYEEVKKYALGKK